MRWMTCLVAAFVASGCMQSPRDTSLGDADAGHDAGIETLAWTTQFGTTGDDAARSVAVDALGNIYVAGRTDGRFPGAPPVDGQAFLRKLDPDRNHVWTRQFGSPTEDWASSVAVDPMGNIVVCGTTAGPLPGAVHSGDEDGFLMKFDAEGTLLWTRQFGSAGRDQAAAVAVDASGFIFVTGEGFAAPPVQGTASAYAAFLQKYDSSGTLLWVRQSGADESQRPTTIAVGASGEVLVGGTAWSPSQHSGTNGSFVAFVRKHDGNGAVVWTRQLAGSITMANALTVDASGQVTIAGETSGLPPEFSQAGARDAYVQRYDANGEPLWSRQFGSAAYDAARGVAVDAAGTIYVVGITRGSLPDHQLHGAQDAFVRRYDTSGRLLWSSQFGTDDTVNAHAVTIDGAGSALVAGSASKALPGQASEGNLDAFVIRMQP
jgi:hypothetical protein